MTQGPSSWLLYECPSAHIALMYLCLYYYHYNNNYNNINIYTWNVCTWALIYIRANYLGPVFNDIMLNKVGGTYDNFLTLWSLILDREIAWVSLWMSVSRQVWLFGGYLVISSTNLACPKPTGCLGQASTNSAFITCVRVGVSTVSG